MHFAQPRRAPKRPAAIGPGSSNKPWLCKNVRDPKHIQWVVGQIGITDAAKPIDKPACVPGRKRMKRKDQARKKLRSERLCLRGTCANRSDPPN